MKRTIEQDPMQAIAYSIGYEWGNLHVTKQAGEAYGIVPLVPVEEGGANPYEHLTDMPSIDLTLCAPDEKDVLVRPQKRRRDKSIVSPVMMPFSSDELKGQVEGAIEHIKSLGYEPEEGDVNFEQVAPQFFAHKIAEVSGFIVSHAVIRHGEQQAEAQLINKCMRVGVSAFLLESLVLSPQFITGDHLIGVGALGVGVLNGLVHIPTMKTVSVRHKTAQIIEQPKREMIAANVGSAVTDSIHKSYCSRHFDQITEALLNGDGKQ